MTMAPARAHRIIQLTFERLTTKLEEMHQACAVRPQDAASAIQVTSESSGEVLVRCSPVVCYVPDRAKSKGSRALYIAFDGRLVVDEGPERDQLRTVSYGTNFAYFVVRDNVASHALGGHYDFTPTHVAHPRAHIQLKSMMGLFEAVREQFHAARSLEPRDLIMRDVLHRVRIPTSQMDFLSFMLQIAADHLVYEKSDPTILQKFDDLAGTCAPLLGFNAPPADPCDCQRVTHWYPPST